MYATLLGGGLYPSPETAWTARPEDTGGGGEGMGDEKASDSRAGPPS